MPYAPIIPLIMRAGPSPGTTLAGCCSEVTQRRERGGSWGGAEIDFICFLSCFFFFLPPHSPPLPTSPQINNNPHCPPPPCPPFLSIWPLPSLAVFWGRNHRLPSCAVSLFFQTPAHVQLPLQRVLLNRVAPPLLHPSLLLSTSSPPPFLPSTPP